MQVAATAFARDYLKTIETSVMGSLGEAGYFVDPTVAEVETAFLPWLMKRVNVQVDKARVARALADDLIRNAHEVGQDRHQRLVAAIMVNRARRDEHRRRLEERHTQKEAWHDVGTEDARSQAVQAHEQRLREEAARQAELKRLEEERLAEEQRKKEEEEEAKRREEAEAAAAAAAGAAGGEPPQEGEEEGDQAGAGPAPPEEEDDQ
ncbi:hypothetical protein PAPYR_2866 [Paratrimastix pyriformis]|uniref:Radial spoke protein 3 n=1 Tax=Paratrimastix pyriformis TaxID=342808 RepID=A0ABQ8UPA8_9EUKA|nr:hypothetical protein PAPYR_2866 [Paratrimastix pyriformis]